MRKLTSFFFLASLFCVTFEKIHWSFAGTVSLADVLAILFLVSFIATTKRARVPRTFEESGSPPEYAAALVERQLDNPPFTGKLVFAQWDSWLDPVFQERRTHERDLATVLRIGDVFFVLRADSP